MTLRRRLLAAAPFPLPGEHPAGYLRRLAIANGFTTLRQMRMVTGIGALSPLSGPATWHRLEAITGLEEERLAPLRWQPNPSSSDTRWIMVDGCAIRLRDLDLVHMRHCPSCLTEDGILRAVWSIRLVTACTVHGTRLIDDCPVCRRVTVLDERMPLTTCATCGTPVAGSRSIPADDEELFITEAIEAACGTRASEDRHRPPDFLAMLAPGIAIATLDRLATIDRLVRKPESEASAPAPKAPPRMSLARQNATAACQMAHAWPRNLLAAVPGMMSPPDPNRADQRSGLTAAFATAAGRLAISPIVDHDGSRIDVVSAPVIDLGSALSGMKPHARAPGTSGRRPSRRSRGPVMSHAAAMDILEGRSDEKRVIWWLEAGILIERRGANERAVLPAALITDAANRLRLREGTGDVGVECDLGWIDRSITTRGAYRKSDFLRDLLAGLIPCRRVDERLGLSGLRFDVRAIERMAGTAKLRDWEKRDHHASLSAFNSVARAVWGDSAVLDMATCDAFAISGGTTPRRYDPPTPGARSQKRWRTSDLASLVATLTKGSAEEGLGGSSCLVKGQERRKAPSCPITTARETRSLERED